ncbi:MAG: hypothetical protein AAB225_08175 [Acidobacteriota bacterium]
MQAITPWLPVIQVTLPIVLAIGIAAWLNNRRIDDVSKRFDDADNGSGDPARGGW